MAARILLVGSIGQLGRELARTLAQGQARLERLDALLDQVARLERDLDARRIEGVLAGREIGLRATGDDELTITNQYVNHAVTAGLR